MTIFHFALSDADVTTAMIITPAHQYKVALGTALQQHMLAWCLGARQQTVEVNEKKWQTEFQATNL